MNVSGFSTEQENFGKMVKLHRKERKLRLLDLEIITGIDDSTLSKIEKGKINVELLTIFKLAKAFEITSHELLDYSRIPLETKTKSLKKAAAKNKKA